MAYDERYPLKDYLNSINYSKDYLMEEDPLWEKNYPEYIVNRCMSQHLDTIMFANEMNVCSHLDKKLQYDFFINTVRPARDFLLGVRNKRLIILNLSSNTMVIPMKRQSKHLGFSLLHKSISLEVN